MRLRGYDSYEVTLGDELRGHRATKGRTLEGVEADLKVRAKFIRAIEDCDLDGFPHASVVPGYVRAYARYLGMNPDEAYAKFCKESGFISPVAAFDAAMQAGAKGAAAAAMAMAPIDRSLTESRFALPPAPARLGARINLGSLTSALALVGLIGGLGYGGYMLLQDLQRVGFAPLPEAPEVVAEAPVIGLPQSDTALLRRPDAADYQGDGVLAAIAPADLASPPLPARDGPISAIDPATSGVFVSQAMADTPPADAVLPQQVAAAPAIPAAEPAAVAEPEPVRLAEAQGPARVFVHATETAWVRIRDGEAAVIFQGMLNAGESFEVPARSERPVLRAGNAGAVYLLVGPAAYGPLGGPGGVVKNLSLLADEISVSFPLADAASLGLPRPEAELQSASAD